MAGSPVGSRGARGEAGCFATGPYLPHTFTGQSGVSRARKVPVPSPAPGYAYFKVTLPNLRGGEGTPKFG